MKEKENLIEKWLDDTLTETELNSLESSSEFASFKKIDALAKRYRAPEFDVSENLKSILATRKQPKKKSNLFTYVASIAAVLVIAFGLFKFIGGDTQSTYYAENGKQENITLPDTSEVILNAASEIRFDQENWTTNRTVSLKGEAFFKVEKGKTFSVVSSQGTVTVLGTEFIVKDRVDYFEVVCYEGLVSVTTDGKTYKLPAGNSIKIVEGEEIKNTILATTPSWISEISIFKSTSLLFVIDELERQYNVTIDAGVIDTSVIFTGSFTHKNLNDALLSITTPLALTFEVDGTNVSLKN